MNTFWHTPEPQLDPPDEEKEELHRRRYQDAQAEDADNETREARRGVYDEDR